MEIERNVDQHVIHPEIQSNFKSMPRKREHLSDSLDFVTFKLLSELKTDQSILPDSLMFLSLKKKFFYRRVGKLIEFWANGRSSDSGFQYW